MKLDGVLRKITYVGLFAALFVPLYIANSLYFPYVSGKNFLFRVIVGVIVATWAMLAVRDKSYRPSKSALLYAFGAFVFVMLLAALFGVDTGDSIWSNFERMEGWITLIHLFGYFVMASVMLNSKKLWTRFIQTSLGVSVLVSLYGVFQLLGVFPIMQGGVRLDSTFGNATYLAIYVVFHIFLALWLLVRRALERRTEDRSVVSDPLLWTYASVVLLELIILYYTATRGAILGLVGGLFVAGVLIALFEKNHLKIRKVATIGVITLLVLVGAFLALKDTAIVRSSPTLARMASISLEDKTTKSRFLIWGMALEGFKDRPVLGWGQENFMNVFNENYNPELYGQEQWFDRAHNVVLDWLVAGGILGLFSYLSLFILLLYAIWKKPREHLTVSEKALFTGAICAYFIHNLFVFDNIGSYIMFVVLLAFAENWGREGGVVEEEEEKAAPLYRKAAVPVIAVAALVLIYLINIPGYMQGKELRESLEHASTGQLDAALLNFRETIEYGSFGTQEAREQLAQTTAALARSDVSTDVKERYLIYTRAQINEQIQDEPRNVRMYALLGAVNSRYGFYEEAISAFERGLEHSPEKQGLFFELASAHLNNDETEKAVEVARKAYELAPEYDEARIIYAAALIYNGEIQRAEALLAEKFGDQIIMDQRIINAYIGAGELDKLLQVAQSRVEGDPANVQYRLSLAAVYLEMGERDRAISTLEDILELSLSEEQREQIEFYISEVKAGRNP